MTHEKSRGIVIESNGVSMGSRVLCADCGKPLPGVSKVEWSLAVGEVAKATITFRVVNVSMAIAKDNVCVAYLPLSDIEQRFLEARLKKEAQQ